jgi:hypothetical protein
MSSYAFRRVADVADTLDPVDQADLLYVDVVNVAKELPDCAIKDPNLIRAYLLIKITQVHLAYLDQINRACNH